MLKTVIAFIQKNIKITFLVVLLTTLFVLIIAFDRGENAAHELIKSILKEYKYCRKVMKKHFNNNLFMSQ